MLLHPLKFSVGVPRFELGLLAPKASMLPLHYTPSMKIFSGKKHAYYHYTTPRLGKVVRARNKYVAVTLYLGVRRY